MYKILVIVSRYSRDLNDPGDFVTQLSEFLKKEYEVNVLAPHDFGLKFAEDINGVRVFRFPYFYPYKFQKLAYGPGILDNIKESILAKIQVPFFIFFELLFSIKVILKTKSNVIHSHWIIPQGLIGALCSAIFNIKHITTIHGSDINMIKKSFFLKILCKGIFYKTDYITVNSSFTKSLLNDFIDKKNKQKIKTIPMGIDSNRFYPSDNAKLKNEDNDENILLFVGRLIDWKGVKYLVQAMPRILNAFPKTKLKVIGEGPEKSKLKKLILKLNLKKNISLLGEIENTKIKYYYSKSDIFIIPSIMVNGHTEGLGVVTVEAMACGIPVIGSNVGGIPDVIRNNFNGYLVPQKSSSILAEKIIDLISNPELKNTFGKNGIKTVKEKFTWSVISKKFIEIIKSD
ncbi:MAG: glycosyl transferase family 1 [Candidatus Marinimicrobia bacterium]|nr:glycosyl transferase family 1 [Candidatus Neomarinimicrobiota bacterium]|tara:strand:- start:1831 stop:3033 length:1203 start_codon:yes stop_codon:yes gene_type:complete